jgi:uncharacterized membrane protein
MFGHFRFGFAALLLVSGFVTPAASNPFTDLFSPNIVPEAAAGAPAAAQEACLLQPGKSTAPGQRWVYRRDGHRKCWFQAEAGTASARKPVNRHAARRRAAAQESESSPRKEKEAIEDARAEMLKPAPAGASETMSHAPEIKLIEATPIAETRVAAIVPAAPVLPEETSETVTPQRPTPPQLNEEALLAAAAAVPDPVDTSAISPPMIAASTPEVSEAGRWSISSWLGLLLMALGGIALLGSSRTRRRSTQVG